MGEEITVSGFAKYRLERAKQDLFAAEFSYKNKLYLTANNIEHTIQYFMQ